MLWEKKSLKFHNKRGYLYLRETIYVRDKRTLNRKPKKFGDGSAFKERGKYSKKKDIYCGKIVSPEIQKFMTFEKYVTEALDYEDFLDFKLKQDFYGILNSFRDYLLYIYDITKDDFENKKVAYEIAGGYFCPQTIDFVSRFRPKKDSSKEIERFANRCIDCGIYDDDIIMLLYSKMMEIYHKEKLSDDDKNYKMEREDFKDYKDFIKGSYKS